MGRCVRARSADWEAARELAADTRRRALKALVVSIHNTWRRSGGGYPAEEISELRPQPINGRRIRTIGEERHEERDERRMDIRTLGGDGGGGGVAELHGGRHRGKAGRQAAGTGGERGLSTAACARQQEESRHPSLEGARSALRPQ